MRIIASITLLLAIVFGARAVPGVTLGYCNGMDAGYGDAGGVVTPWVVFPAQSTQMYAGSSLKKVKIGLLSKANNVTVYLKHSLDDTEPFYSKKIGTLEAGWHEVDIDTPYAITDGEDVAVGYKATFSKAGGVAYSQGTPVAEACRAFYNTKNSWIDVKGAFCIQAVLEGENLIADELGLLALSEGTKDYFQTFTSVAATVKNYGCNTVENFTLSYKVDDADPVTVSFDGPILSGETGTYEIQIPEQGVGVHPVLVSVEDVNGVPDAYTYNNTLTTTITERDPAFIRRVVVEEGTGTWCGWCPRGIVGLDMMAEKYPEQFIPIALHTGDRMAVAGYDKSFAQMPSLPNSYVDRHIVGDPYYAIENNFLKEVSEDCHVAYDITGAFVTDGKLRVVSRVMVDRDTPARSLNAAFTVTEDGLTGKQANSYSGSSEEMGGWELLPSEADCVYDFVARGIYPSYEGECFLTGTLVPGESYEFSYEFELPQTIKNVKRVSVIGQIIDSGNGFILNAKKVSPEVKDDAGVESNGFNARETVYTEVYSLDGVCLYRTEGNASVSVPTAKGTYIVVRVFADGNRQSLKVVR